MSARISALNIVGELLRKVGVSPSNESLTHNSSKLLGRFLAHRGTLFSQNLESKLASCREYVQEQTANRKDHAGREGATSSHSNPSATNGIYSKGCVKARKQCFFSFKSSGRIFLLHVLTHTDLFSGLFA